MSNQVAVVVVESVIEISNPNLLFLILPIHHIYYHEYIDIYSTTCQISKESSKSYLYIVPHVGRIDKYNQGNNEMRNHKRKYIYLASSNQILSFYVIHVSNI